MICAIGGSWSCTGSLVVASSPMVDMLRSSLHPRCSASLHCLSEVNQQVPVTGPMSVLPQVNALPGTQQKLAPLKWNTDLRGGQC